MREILFKAKRKDNGEWIVGKTVLTIEYEDVIAAAIAAIEHNPTTGFSIHQIFEVHPETVCQYTGLKDKNGNKIWEGDKVKHLLDGVLDWEVIYRYGCFGIRNIGIDGFVNRNEFHPIDTVYFFNERTVTGNIHD